VLAGLGKAELVTIKSPEWRSVQQIQPFEYRLFVFIPPNWHGNPLLIHEVTCN
jgi:hypothetical protein